MATLLLGTTPLYNACNNGNLGMAKLLLLNGANFHEACRSNNLEMVTLLLPLCATETINKAIGWGKTPLYIACDKNNIEIVKLLLLNGANATQKEIEANQNTKPHLEAVQKYNDQETIIEKITYILSEEKNNELFNFLIKLCLAKSLENIIKNGAALDSTTFYEIYKDKEIDLEKVFGIKKNENLFGLH